MAKIKDIHDIQQDHFSKPSEDWTDHYAVDDKELEKHLDYVSKVFMKKEREMATQNKKEYLSSKFDKNKDNMYSVYHQKEK